MTAAVADPPCDLTVPHPTSHAGLFIADSADSAWWRDAVVYQVYLRSFGDSNGDGIGDIPGLRSRLPYLRWLGVDAVWLTPHYPSGSVDGGYDVRDYRQVDPEYGTVSDIEGLCDDAHRLGLRVLLDIVPNHTSDQHPWFQDALNNPRSAAASRYLFVPRTDDVPPNNWQSLFGGSAWSATPDGERWYLHLFAPGQPDLNWRDQSVNDYFDQTLRFWLDLGVDGFRVDVAYGLFKDAQMRDNPGTYSPGLFGHGPEQRHTWNQPEVHEVWRRWRAIADTYPGDRLLVGEVCLADMDQVAKYAGPGQFQQAFAFRLLKSPWDAAAFTDAICDAVRAFSRTGAVVPWVLGNHDKQRQVTRFGGGEVGTARARAALLLLLALPGAAYLYAGDELGLPEADVAPQDRRDPIFWNSGGVRNGRDGCRVPMPWSPSGTSCGFSPAGADRSWLPQPTSWSELSVAAQAADPASMLTLYRQALAARKALPVAGPGQVQVRRHHDLVEIVVTDDRQSLTCWVNMGNDPVQVPQLRVVLASGTVTCAEGVVTMPGDTAVWVTA